ncbi:MAG: family 43 glycosylhydrolase [Nibricoccus sp.]
MHLNRAALFLTGLAVIFASPKKSWAETGDEYISPAMPWLDDRGKHIQAHGGSVIRYGDTWYWIGEDRSRDNDPMLRCVSCYSSRDLVHWKFRNQILRLADPENFGSEWVLERPKVYHNVRTGKFVLYMHVDGRMPGSKSRYSIARVGVAVCDKIDGDYEYVRSFRPLGKESRDIGQFIDDDGEAYLVFESRPEKGFYIAKLSADYLDVERAIAFIRAPLEGGAVVHYDGLYYVIGSQLTGWWPNANKYATAERLDGPWSEFKDFAPPESHTYLSQSTNLLKVVGSKKTTVIYLGDMWRPQELWDSRYLWHPVQIGGGQLRLAPSQSWEPDSWRIDVATGDVTTCSK